MAAKAAPQVQHDDLIARAVELGRFAARLSSEWMSSGRGRPSLIGVEVRKKLRDKSRKAVAAMRSAAVQLRAAAQSVADAMQESDDVYEARHRALVAKRRTAEQAAAGAPATAVKLFDQALERKYSEAPGAADAQTAGGRRFMVILNGIVQPLLGELENEVADEWLRKHGSDLRRQLHSFEASFGPRAEAMARLSPDGGRRVGQWCNICWSGLLVAVVGDLIKAVDAGDQGLLISAIEALQTKQLAIGVALELAKDRDEASDCSDSGLRGHSRAVLLLIGRAVESRGQRLICGARVKRDEVMALVAEAFRASPGAAVPVQTARQYLAPSSRLCRDRLIERDGDDVVLTEKGAACAGSVSTG